MSVDLEILGDLAGYTIGLLIALTLIGGVLYLQWYEFCHWQHSRLSFWILKLTTPAAGLLIVVFALMLGAGVEGLEALGFLYGGILAALVGAPFVMIALGKLFGVPAPDTLRSAASVVLLFVVLWFSGASAFNSLNLMFGTNYSERHEYLSWEAADDTDALVTDEVTIVRESQFRLPDGKRFIYLVFAVDPEVEIRRFQVSMDRQWTSNTFWGGIQGSCVTPGHYHFTNVVDEVEALDIRFLVHRGTPDSMRVLKQTISFPNADDETDGYFQVFTHGGFLTLPVPLPASRVTLVRGDDEINQQDDVPGRTPRQYKGVHSNQVDCLDEELFADADLVRIELHAEELYDHPSYRFKPREVAPEYR
ncbi:MAG: hypothetical protein AAF525_16230 [Pseudomonadota bacterium]